MSDIQTSTPLPLVRTRDDGRSHGGGAGHDASGPPPKKVADAYGQTAKAKPLDDRITILGIPAEQITPATQAALASLVAEVNFLRSAVRRLEGGSAKRDAAPAEGEILTAENLPIQLGRFLTEQPPEGVSRILVLAYLSTFEDVRRSSGLLAANSLLSDLAQRMNGAEFFPDPSVEVPDAPLPDPIPMVTKSGKVKMVRPETPPKAGLVKFRMMGFAGGSSLVGLAEMPSVPLDETYVARQVRDHCLATGFNVSGIDMSVALSVAAVVLSSSEGVLTAMARADHLLRGSSY